MNKTEFRDYLTRRFASATRFLTVPALKRMVVAIDDVYAGYAETATRAQLLNIVVDDRLTEMAQYGQLADWFEGCNWLTSERDEATEKRD